MLVTNLTTKYCSDKKDYYKQFNYYHCNYCNETKTIDNFWVTTIRGKPYIPHKCKTCASELHKAYYESRKVQLSREAIERYHQLSKTAKEKKIKRGSKVRREKNNKLNLARVLLGWFLSIEAGYCGKKYCTAGNHWVDEKDFYRRKASSDGLQSRCKRCDNIYK